MNNVPGKALTMTKIQEANRASCDGFRCSPGGIRACCRQAVPGEPSRFPPLDQAIGQKTLAQVVRSGRSHATIQPERMAVTNAGQEPEIIP